MLDNILLLANDTEHNAKNKAEFIGDPVEIALSKYLYNINKDIDQVREKYKRIGEVPFDSSRKMMSSINKVDGETIMFTKGSLQAVLEKSTKIFIKMAKYIS